MNLEELKKEYYILEKKYKLPAFSELNENFDIEKLKKGKELLLRSIRKIMTEKVFSLLGFVEILLNPMNAPRMYLSYIKSMTSEDKKEVDKVYSVLSDVIIAALKLEIDYSEKEEAEMIKKIMKDWDSVKPEFRKIIAGMQKPLTNTQSKEKSYFG